MKVFTVKEPLFKVEPLFVLGCDPDQLAQYFHKRRFRVDVSMPQGLAGMMMTFDRVPWRVVWTRGVDAPVALHEVFHLVTRICQDRGIPIRAQDADGNLGDEPAAYLFEFFARAVLKRLCRPR